MSVLQILALLWFPFNTHAVDIKTNEVDLHDSPKWVTRSRIEKVVHRIQQYLEWDIRRVNVIWIAQQNEFEKSHGMGPTVRAITFKQENKILVGPSVTAADFDSVFGHELVHIILFQKFKESIPRWLEEGLANYIAQMGKPNYIWLSQQRLPQVEGMQHPFKGKNSIDPALHYQSSTAVMEMLAQKCDIRDLIQLAVGKKLETYLKNTCEIKNIQKEFEDWVKKKGRVLVQAQRMH